MRFDRNFPESNGRPSEVFYFFCSNQLGVKGKTQGQIGKIWPSQASRAVAWWWGGGGGRAAEPGDSFDRCLCSMIQDSGIMLWLVKCFHVDRFAVLLTLPHSTRPYHSPKRAINMPVICCKKKNTLLKYRAFLILSCDKLWSHLRNDWLIDRRSKGTAITNQWIHAMHVAYS